MPASFYCATCLHSFTREVPQCPNLGCGVERPASGWGRVLGTGDVLDRHYVVDRVLAVGGAGITYLARTAGDDGAPTGDALAVKVLFHSRDGGSHLRRLSVEAQALRDLAHKNIVEYRAFVHRAGGSPYLVTRYEPGGDLHHHVRRVGPLEVPVALAILRQVLAALAVAHQHGIVHRDLKPENVLLEAKTPRTQVPRVRVTDFGVAKMMTARAGLTRVGAFIGTPEFAAPEQFVGEPATPATDVFAAGALFAFVVTGNNPVPFTDRNDLARCYQEVVAGSPPDLAGVDVPVPLRAPLTRLLEGMMHVEARERWNTATARAEIEALILPEPQPEGARVAPVWTPSPTPRAAQPVVPAAAPSVHDLTAEVDSAPTVDDPPAAAPIEPEAPAWQTLEDVLAPARASDRVHTRGDAPEGFRPRSPTLRPLTVDASEPPSFSSGRRANDEPTPPPRARRRGYPPGHPLHRAASSGELDETDPTFDPGRYRSPPKPATDAQTIVLQVDGTLWVPPSPRALGDPPPGTAAEILHALGNVAAPDREALVELLAAMDEASVTRALRTAASHREACTRAGAMLAIAGLQRTDMVASARMPLTDRDAGVRSCAAHALGIVGRAGSIPNLSRALGDADPTVRATATLAIARAARAAGRPDLALGWLDRAAADNDASVAAAAALARGWLR